MNIITFNYRGIIVENFSIGSNDPNFNYPKIGECVTFKNRQTDKIDGPYRVTDVHWHYTDGRADITVYLNNNVFESSYE